MKFLVVGCGSIGQRHIGNLLSLSAGEIIACDTRQDRLQAVSEKYGLKIYTDVEQALEQKVNAVLICSPTSLHIPTALSAAERELHLFIEKPLSHTLEGVDQLARTTSTRGLTALVGCNMRFFPTIKLVKDLIDEGRIGRVLAAKASWGFYLPYWHPDDDYRKNYTAISPLGGGIILDNVHELDFLRWMLGEVKEVSCFLDKLSNLEMDTEDVAGILLRFESRALASIHFDCLQPTYRRSCEFIGEEGIIVADIIEQRVELLTREQNQWQVFSENIKTDVNQMYIEEMKHFIDCIEGRDTPMLDIAGAKRVLQIVLAAKESAETKTAVSI